MRNNIVIELVTGIWLLGLSSMANSAVLTFDDLEILGGDSTQMDTYSDQGFIFSSRDYYTDLPTEMWSWKQDNINYNSSAALFGELDTIITLSAVDGSLFNLDSIDLTFLYKDPKIVVKPSTVTFNAYDSSDQLIAAEAITLIDHTWVTYVFSAEFDNAAYVEWDSLTYPWTIHQFDNVTISAVPIPAAVWLFGSGLLGLIGVSRRKKV